MTPASIEVLSDDASKQICSYVRKLANVAESTRHAVLGLVAREPTHGYALYAEIERWPLPGELRPGRSTVYRHLERLSEGRLIAPQRPAAEAASRHPDRTVYAVTPIGIDELDRYARTRPRSFDDLCVRVSIARPEDVPLLIDFAADLERTSLRRFQEWSTSPEPLALAERDAPWRSVLRALVAKSQAADVAGMATVLGDLRSDLEALRRHAGAEG